MALEGMGFMYKEDLDNLVNRGCACPDCKDKGMFINPICHFPTADLHAAYADGKLTLQCSKCEKKVAIIMVASKPSPGIATVES